MRFLRLSAGALLVLAAVPAQIRALPVHDLLYEPAARERYLEGLRSPELFAARHVRGERALGGVPESNDWPFPDLGGRGHFARDQLESLLAVLGIHPAARLFGRTLIVPEDSAEAAARILDDLRKALPPRLEVDVRLVQTVGGERRVRLQRRVAVDPGRLCVVSEVGRRMAVIGYNVEIAQEAMIADPTVTEVRAGVMVALRAQLTPSGEWALLETVARCVDGDPAATIDTGHPGLGPIDRVAMAIAESARVVLVRPGARTVQRWSGAAGAFELTLETQWRLPQPVRPGGHDLGVFSVRGELAGFRSVPVRVVDGEEYAPEEELEDPWADVAAIAGPDAGWRDAPDADESPGAQRYVALDAAMWSIGAAAMRWFAAHDAGPDLAVRCYDVPAGADLGADGSAPDGARALGETVLSQVDGTWSTAAVRAEHSVLHDWNVEVASGARIPQPRCRRVSTGLVLNLRRLGDEVEVDGELASITDEGRRTLALSQPIFTRGVDVTPVPPPPGGGGGGQQQPGKGAGAGLPGDVVRVEQPTVVALPVQFTRRLDGDRPAVWRTSAAELLGPDRDLVVVVARAP